MRRSLQEARRPCGGSSAGPRLEPAASGAGPTLYSGIGAPMGMGMEVAKSPGTCWGPRIMLKEVQKISPASRSSVSETKHSPLSCRTQRPHGLLLTRFGTGPSLGHEPSCRLVLRAWPQTLHAGLLAMSPKGAPAQRMQGRELVLLRPRFKSLLYVGEGGLSPVFLSLPVSA